MEKIVYFVLCRSSRFGILSPLSYFGEKRILEGIEKIRDNENAFLYIALYRFDMDNEHDGAKRIEEIKKSLPEDITKRIHYCNNVGRFENFLFQFISNVKMEVCIECLANSFLRRIIKKRIEKGKDFFPGTNFPYAPLPKITIN